MRLVLICTAVWILALAATGVLAGESAPSAGGDLVLNWETGYWRYFLTYGLPQYADRAGVPWPGRGVHGPGPAVKMKSPEAPADWMKPEFDDSIWPRERRPEAGCEVYDSVVQEPFVRIRYLRNCFDVPDPARVAGLEAVVEYIGGVAVYLNGQEVKRANLPDGPLTYETFGENYPPEAYIWLTNSQSGYPMVSPFAWDVEANRKYHWNLLPGGGAGRTSVADVKDSGRYRSLTVSLDPKLLRKGANVLAVRVHQSKYNQLASRWTSNSNNMRGAPHAWSHNAVRKLELRASPAGAVPVQARPAGLQVWVEDVHRRVVNRDFGEPGDRPQAIRIAGAKNGSYSGVAVVGNSAAVPGLSAQVSGFAQTDGAGKIPAAAVRVRYGVAQTLDEAPKKKPSDYTYYNQSTNRMLERYCQPAGFRFATSFGGDRARLFGPERAKEIQAEAKVIKRFDQLSDTPPAAGLPAGESLPIWITVRIPKDAPAGDYQGTLTIKAGEERKVPVRLRVFDVALPDGKDYASYAGFRQDVMDMGKAFKCQRWSEEHWRLVEQSVQMLGEAGADLVYLPLITYTESGNDESIVPWVKKDDAYDYDWRNLDRYLALIEKHWGKEVDVVGDVCWAPWAGGKEGWPLHHKGVTVIDGGQKKELPLPAVGTDEWRKVFPPFAKAVRAHLLEKGFKRLHWGWFYDGVTDKIRTLAEELYQVVPEVGWARSNHEAVNPAFLGKESKCQVTLNCHIRVWPFVYSHKGEYQRNHGWKKRYEVHFTRAASWIQVLSMDEGPMGLRWMTESALVHGAAGWARFGADCWPPNAIAAGNNWYADVEPNVFWPAAGGVESSVRFEALREGIQEAEARIMIEKAGKDLEEPAKSVLMFRAELTEGLNCDGGNPLINEYYGGWQERSWDLYAAAAAVLGGKAPSAEEKTRFFGAGK